MLFDSLNTYNSVFVRHKRKLKDVSNQACQSNLHNSTVFTLLLTLHCQHKKGGCGNETQKL